MKTALVTGASEGIGRAFAKRLSQDGYCVTLVARNEMRLRELIKEIGAEAGHKVLVADLSTDKGQRVVVTELEDNHYNLLINNAGYGVYSSFWETPVEKFQAMLRVNCDALVAFSHAFLKKASDGDALINVSSTLAFLPMPIGALYAASKAFVTSFTECLWYEQKSRGVYVMGLCPGITATNFNERAGGTQELPAALTQQPEDVVHVAMKALQKREEPTVISGPKNRFAAGISRIFPRKSLITLMGKRK